MADSCNNIRRDWLVKRRLELRKSLSDIADMHVWRDDKGMAQLERRLVDELAFIECKLTEDTLQRR